MSETIFIKPAADGLVVRDPVTKKALAAQGEWKPISSYWSRRLLDGDVVAGSEPSDLSDSSDRTNTKKEAPKP